MDDLFPFLIHKIIEQMLSVKAGAKIYSKLETLCSRHVTPLVISNLSLDDRRSVGASSKVKSIKSVAESVLNSEISSARFSTMTDEAVLKKPVHLQETEMWIAKMYLIFVLNRQDILLYEVCHFCKGGYKWVYKTNDTSKTSIVKNGNLICPLPPDFYIEHWIWDSQKKNFICTSKQYYLNQGKGGEIFILWII